MRKLLLLLTLVFVSTMAKADDMVLQIWQSDGQVVSISLNEEPKTTYVDGKLVITTTKTTITYPLEKVRRYTYTSTEGISSPEAMKATFSDDGETLTFTGLKPNTTLYLYNVAGQLLRKIDSAQRSKATVSVSGLPPELPADSVVPVPAGVRVI